MSGKEKKFSISIDPKVNSPTFYDYFLVRSSEEGLRIDFALANENKDEINLKVRESIAVSADQMLQFAVEVIRELTYYESKYHNGKGIPRPE